MHLPSRFASLSISAGIFGVVKDPIKDYLANIGRKGGKARVKNQTLEQRIESARRAAEARWAKIGKSLSQTDAQLTEVERAAARARKRKAAEKRKESP